LPARFLAFLLVCTLSAACGRGPAPAAEPPIFPVKKKWVAFLPLDEEIVAPLASDASRLFLATGKAVRGLDRSLGTTLWARPGVSGILSAAPGVLVVRAESGRVTSLDPATGATRWSTETGATGALQTMIEGTRVYVTGSRYTVLDTASGKLLADLPLESAAVTRPVRWDECLLVGHADATLRCLEADTGNAVWSFPMSKPLEAAPAVDGDRVFVGTGASDRRALGFKGGRKLDWTFELGAGVPVPPAAAARYALIASNEAVLYAFLRRNGHMAWRAPLPSRPLGPPIVVGTQALVACLPDELLAFQIDTGKGAGSTHVGLEHLGSDARSSEIRTPPIYVERTIYVGLRNPWAVVALEPGAAPKAPEPPAPFDADPAEDVAKPSPIP